MSPTQDKQARPCRLFGSHRGVMAAPAFSVPSRSTRDGGRSAEGVASIVAVMTGSPQIGASARRTRTVTRHDIELFTEMTGDRNPIHYDDELARGSRFGGIVVQGGVTTGLLNALVAEQLPGPGSVFLEVAWRFLAPVRPGDVITAEATVTGTRTDKPVTTLATRITNQDGIAVIDGTAVVWRDPVVAECASPRKSLGRPGEDAPPSVLATQHTTPGDRHHQMEDR
jgi:acyl dehydratase